MRKRITRNHPMVPYVPLMKPFEDYKYYKKEPGRRKLQSVFDFREIYSEIFKEIRKQIVDSQGGVFIRGVGYFFVWKIPRKMYIRFWHKPFYGHSYSIRFVPVRRLRGWSMHAMFTTKISKGVSKNVKKGFKYKTYLYSLRAMKLMN
jgi:hypothetical protein